jgi:prepilin-type N-terminal cleavage/methylation domain-containing protein
MKKRGFTLVEIMIVVAIIGILLGIAIPSWVQVRKEAWEKVRLQNCAVIDRAKEQWIQENGKLATDVPSAADLSPEYIDPFPTDPAGTYEINPGHEPCTFVPN